MTPDISTGNGGLSVVRLQSSSSTAEVYLNGGHLSGFQKAGEPPLLFMSTRSHFREGAPIRGGVPICYPWFGPRDGDAAHGYGRTAVWEVVEQENSALRLRLPEVPGRDEWNVLDTEFSVRIDHSLAMELVTTNRSDRAVGFENCLHTYFHVGEISKVSVTGLQGLPFLDFASGATGQRKVEHDDTLRIFQETNRVYPNSGHAVEIADESLGRVIRIEKSGSQSTVVWNPWTTQKLPDDFDPAEYASMLCIESGNVKENRIVLGPGDSASLKVVVTSRRIA